MYICLTKYSKVYHVYNSLPNGLYDLGDGLYMDADDKLYFFVRDGYLDYYGSNLYRIGDLRVYTDDNNAVYQVGGIRIYIDDYGRIYNIDGTRISRDDNGYTYAVYASNKTTRFSRDSYGKIYSVYN